MTSRVRNGGNEKDQRSTRNRVSHNCFISKLPNDILHDIFFRIPIKGVSLCKCVCPAWNNLLSESIFSEKYATKSPFSSLLYCIDRCTGRSAPPNLELLEISENGDMIRSRIMLKLPHRFQGKPIFFIGSCNGLLCMKLYLDGCRVVYVTNPISREGTELPKYHEIPNDKCSNFKFGFSPTTNKYKVLRIALKPDVGTDGYNVGEFEIITVGVDDRWRSLPDSSTTLPIKSEFVALNGFFHWIRNDKGPDVISTFDLAEEKFGQISIPSSLLLVFKPVHLTIFGNEIGLVDFSVRNQVSIWTMKKYSVVESWTKVVILNCWLPRSMRTGAFVTVAALQNGDMLFQGCATDLIYCNLEEGRCTMLHPKHVVMWNPSRCIFRYTPSFSTRAELIPEREECLLLCAEVIMRKRRHNQRIRLQ